MSQYLCASKNPVYQVVTACGSISNGSESFWMIYSVRWKCLNWMKVSDNRTGRPEILLQYVLPSTELKEVNGNARERKKAAFHLGHQWPLSPPKKNLLHALHSGQRGNKEDPSVDVIIFRANLCCTLRSRLHRGESFPAESWASIHHSSSIISI